MSSNDKIRSGNVVDMHGSAGADPATRAGDFVRDHPLLVVAGGIAVGAVVAALLPRGTSRKLARRAISLAELAGTAGALLGTRVRDTAENTGASLRERGGIVAGKLEKLGETATGKIGKIGGAASAQAEKLIEPVESAAAKVVSKAAALRSRVKR